MIRAARFKRSFVEDSEAPEDRRGRGKAFANTKTACLTLDVIAAMSTIVLW